MGKVFRWIGFASIFLITVSLSAAIFASPKFVNKEARRTESIAERSKSKTWATVYSFKGNGKKKSTNFELTGDDAKLVYSYKSAMAGAGLFAAYVVKKGVDVMVSGGIPEVMVNKSEDSESALQKPSGTYYLDVNGVGDWKIDVMELK